MLSRESRWGEDSSLRPVECAKLGFCQRLCDKFIEKQPDRSTAVCWVGVLKRPAGDEHLGVRNRGQRYAECLVLLGEGFRIALWHGDRIEVIHSKGAPADKSQTQSAKEITKEGHGRRRGYNQDDTASKDDLRFGARSRRISAVQRKMKTSICRPCGAGRSALFTPGLRRGVTVLRPSGANTGNSYSRTARIRENIVVPWDDLVCDFVDFAHGFLGGGDVVGVGEDLAG